MFKSSTSYMLLYLSTTLVVQVKELARYVCLSVCPDNNFLTRLFIATLSKSSLKVNIISQSSRSVTGGNISLVTAEMAYTGVLSAKNE